MPPDERGPASQPAPGEKRPKRRHSGSPSRDGASLVLTRPSQRSAPRSACYTADGIEEESTPRPGGHGLDRGRLAEILASTRGDCTPSCETSVPLPGSGAAWANEILHHAQLSPYGLTTELTKEEVARLGEAIDAELARGLELRERGAADRKTYRIHDRLGGPCLAAGHRSPASTSRSTRSTTARPARPRAGF